MNEQEALRSLAGAEVGRLATVDPTGHPHLVPFVFVVEGRSIVTVIDNKPKRTRALKRLANIAANPRVSVLVDHYETDWSRLWWVRADGQARVVRTGHELERCITLLSRAYPQYAVSHPPGPAIVIEIAKITG
ncbi:MAG: TIGR03668 family PPOX class F420-dependent oxidoreductase, partial [Acidimicrobiia bacterium]|nr:TIGR03668 family PPOX class F420-dependent oxidoreductase [Acidimicrobiia bacterium]